MNFILYDIILNLNRVDEAYDAHAEIQDKFIVLSTPHDQFRNLDGDKFLFDVFRDDLYENHSEAKVNTRFRVYSNQDPNVYQDYYAHLSYGRYLLLCWRLKKLWIQKTANIMWLLNLIVAIMAIITTYYVTLLVGKKNDFEKIEIINTVKLDEDQLEQIKGAIDKNKTLQLDTSVINQIIKQLKTKSKPLSKGTEEKK